jgi:hypothetical protein
MIEEATKEIIATMAIIQDGAVFKGNPAKEIGL